MTENNTKYFTTGEFAKLCKVNKQTLFYYDQIGILSPIRKNEKGYRYYSFHQLELFAVIALLKDLGMSLDEIKQYTQNKSPEKMLKIMYEQQEKILEERRRLEMKVNMIEGQIQSLNEATKLDFQQIRVERLPKQTLYLSNNIENASDQEFVEAFHNFLVELSDAYLDTGYPIGTITSRENALKGDFTNYSYLYNKQLEPKIDHSFFQTVDGDFLVGYHIGEYQHVGQTYQKLLQEMDRRHLEIGEYILEEYVYEAAVKNREEEYVLKIMIHVENKE
ncbi:MerR family transcriptional regulator [Gracilibacillus sp. S3-1-1]|uniref:MerR family transcriptional regulator n=1 Tax=Gracilibacillus pellucidus TaxID=3095368 RepID=A0ACC6M0Q7_9BACI|nr:MerR family transcriptional regulator [Gracilibacillus sp. S3-1-1]MDX8044516.1 MerR family transcriptional regulator [Gracilibacillus sp. S3-1-1]